MLSRNYVINQVIDAVRFGSVASSSTKYSAYKLKNLYTDVSVVVLPESLVDAMYLDSVPDFCINRYWLFETKSAYLTRIKQLIKVWKVNENA